VTRDGADIAITDIERWAPLNSALLSGHVDVVKLLLEKGVDVTAATPLNSASSNEHIDVVKLFLEKRADATAARTDGRTPLNSALFRKEVLLLFGHKGSGGKLYNIMAAPK
jgi:ankyrin repeat protein